MNQIFRKIPAKYRPYILPLLTLIFIIAISATFGKWKVDSLINYKSELDQIAQDNKALEAKIEVISKLDKTQLATNVKDAVEAIPIKSSTLPAISTLRTLAAKRSLDLSNFSVLSQGNDIKAGNSVEITASVQGKKEDILKFLEDLKVTSPLILTSSTNLAISEDSSRVSINVLSYWASLPTDLGKASQSVEALKKSEQDQLKLLEELKSVEGGPLVPSAPQGRDNPFSF